MMYGLTGTPGVGKTEIGALLAKEGYPVLCLTDTVSHYILNRDEERDSWIVDIDRWAMDFQKFDGFVEGHIAHYLPCDRIIILRCRPDRLMQRLMDRGYKQAKVKENCEAEALDLILQEVVENFPPSIIFEVDTTDSPPESSRDKILAFIRGELPPSFGENDWIEYCEVSN